MADLLRSKHPYLTSSIPGVGGTIKNTPADFIVEEVLSYHPCGSGEHLYLTIEKDGITTLEAIHRIAGALKLSERDIGYAGMKDAAGVTTQTISVQRVSPEQALALNLPGIKVVSATFHTNKLKLCHLKGNRFKIVVRGISEEAKEIVPVVIDTLLKRGIPNYFGFQRYGVQGNSHLVGLSMLRRDWQDAIARLIGELDAVHDEEWRTAIAAYHQGDLDTALQHLPRHCRAERDVLKRLASRPGEYQKAFTVLHPRLKKLYLSAVQSYLFDQVVAERIDQIDAIMTGDLAFKHTNGACFLVEDEAAESERVRMFEISASGAMFGCKMKQPGGVPRQLEQTILGVAELNPADFDLPGGLRVEGERRPLRVPLTDVRHRIEGDSLLMEFSLPRGSYATSVLRECLKTF